jgi:AcrR family transcriptional regulator
MTRSEDTADAVPAPARPRWPDETTAYRTSRRTRILEESLAAAAAGCEDLNIRTVAERAGVAVGTLYSYFSSKEHLLVSALGRWLEGFEEQVVPQLYNIDNPYERLCHLVEELSRAFDRRPLLAEALGRSYVVAGASVALEVETVRSQLINMFADAFSQGSPNQSQFDVGGLLTDVLASNLLTLARHRAQMCDIRRRFGLVLEVLAKRYGAEIGRPDWGWIRNPREHSAQWFYDWPPLATGHRPTS